MIRSALLPGIVSADKSDERVSPCVICFLGLFGLLGSDPSRSRTLAQPRKQCQTGIAIGRRHADLLLERLGCSHGVATNAPVRTTRVVTKSGQSPLDFLNFAESRRPFRSGKLLNKRAGTTNA